jgi:hypothetical protein
MKKYFLTTITLALSFAGTAMAQMPADSYSVESITLPKNVAPEVGGLAFTDDKRLVVVTRRSGVWMGTVNKDPEAFQWSEFVSSSLHNPMGVYVVNDKELLIPTMQELTRVTDTDGDGKADRFMAVARDAWGLSGNYHETVAGPLPDGKGGWLLAPGTASYNGPTFDIVKGKFSKVGRRGRNNSSVENGGWVLNIKANGDVEQFASGFRMPNGIGLSPDGKLWSTDNQGDWIGTTPIYHVEKGNFYGHPSSLVWDKTFFEKNGDPLKYGVDKLDAMRTRAAVLLPHGIVCNSATQPLFDTTNGQFGPFAGQMFVGDVAGQRILRVMLEEVDGVMQGAATKFIEGMGLRAGNNRLVFNPEGDTLYVGQTVRGWGKPSEGLQRITFKGKTPMDVLATKLTKTGFEITFTQPVDPSLLSDISHYQISHYYYSYGPAYGSDQIDKTNVNVKAANVLEGGKRVQLVLADDLIKHRIYQIDFTDISSTDGTEMANPNIYYTINRLRK